MANNMGYYMKRPEQKPDQQDDMRLCLPKYIIPEMKGSGTFEFVRVSCDSHTHES